MAARTRFPFPNRLGGYTLIEAAVAMTIFIAVALPIFSFAFKGAYAERARNLLTATFLLEQEVARLKAMPGSAMPTRLVNADNRQWRIDCRTEGSQPPAYRLTAELQDKKIGEVVVMLPGTAGR